MKNYTEFLTEMSTTTARMVQSKINQIIEPTEFKVVFTNHFLDRLQGREESVRTLELFDTFSKFFKKYNETLENMDDHKEVGVILKDYARELNIPLEIKFDENSRDHKITVLGITIMRKEPNSFRTNNSGGKELRMQ